MLPYLERINQLSRTLQKSKLPPAELARFLYTETFKELEPTMIMSCELFNDGMVHMNASIGLPEEYLNRAQDFPVNLQVPTNDALRNHKLVWLSGDEESLRLDYPDLPKFAGTNRWGTLVVFPTFHSSIASGATTLTTDLFLTPSPELETFIWTVAHLTSLNLTSLNQQNPKVDTRTIKAQGAPAKPAIATLTSRQNLILKYISEGYTNAEIAAFLSYSHSTIRQEAIRIFVHLKVDNREDAASIYNRYSDTLE